MFAGNIGKVQNVEVILKAAKMLKDKKVRFHIVGDGTDVDRLKVIKDKHNLNNVIFHGRQPLEKMPEYYSIADAMIVTMEDDPILSLTLPGKVQTYMAAGKPIIGSINGETAKVIKAAHCGYCGQANDVTALADCINHFLIMNDKTKLSHSSREFYESHFTREIFMNTLEKEMKRFI